MGLTRPITRPLTRSIARGLTEPGSGGGGPAPDPLLEAALALNPVWLYDHKDIGSFFTDVAMTTPAAVGNQVAAVMDKSGNGRHRTQSTLASRPFLRQSGSLYYLEYDGSNDFMVTAAINLTATDAVTLCMGARALSDAAIGTICEFSASATTNNGAFALFKPLTATTSNLASISRGTTAAVPSYTNAAIAAPVTLVMSCINKISTLTALLRSNGVQVATNLGSQGTGNYGNHITYFGRRGGTSLPFNGHDYGGALYATNYSGTDLDAIEDFVADRTGVTL